MSVAKQYVFQETSITEELPYGLSAKDSDKDKLIKIVAIARDEGIMVDIKELGGGISGLLYYTENKPYIVLERYPKGYRYTIQAVLLFLKVHWGMIKVEAEVLEGRPVWIC